MKLLLYRQLWGLEKPWDHMLTHFAEFGYVGVEVALPFVEPVDTHRSYFEKFGLSCLPMIFTGGSTVAEHVQSFRVQLEKAAQFEPVVVTCHDGRDAWSEDEAEHYFSEVLTIERDLDVTVAHETHRGRVLFNPWITARLMDRFDELQLCCDFSHWVCVCERLLHDQMDIIKQCAERAVHLHARVGYNEGPQVPDPRAPEYAAELEAHEQWWDEIWDAQERRGMTATTLTPEFGPPPYMHTMPFTQTPVADVQSVSDWQAARQRDRFMARVATT